MEGFTFKNGNQVYKLHRSIYGMKQASRSWNFQFDEIIKEFCFSQNQDEACVYKKVNGSVVMSLVLNVDDMQLIGDDVLVL